jgi:hypothetical protein
MVHLPLPLPPLPPLPPVPAACLHSVTGPGAAWQYPALDQYTQTPSAARLSPDD